MSDDKEDLTASGDDSETEEDYVPGVDPDASDSELQRPHKEPSASAMKRHEAAADKQQPEQENRCATRREGYGAAGRPN